MPTKERLAYAYAHTIKGVLIILAIIAAFAVALAPFFALLGYNHPVWAMVYAAALILGCFFKAQYEAARENGF